VASPPPSLTRLLKPAREQLLHTPLLQGLDEPLVSAAGCVCISWTRHRRSGRFVYVPVLGLSGVVEAEPDLAFFRRYCRHLALPEVQGDPGIPKAGPDVRSEEMRRLNELTGKAHMLAKPYLNKKDLPDEPRALVDDYTTKKAASDSRAVEERQYNKERRRREELANELTVNYETMIARTNLAAISYHARKLLGLRTPSRQALMSYVSFREKKQSAELAISKLQDAGSGVDLWICGWHSLNCAEPAALMCASIR
jgi:hypothetical protein